MACKVRLRKQAKTGNSARTWKLVPMRFPDRTKIKLRNHLREQGPQQ